MSVYYDKQGCPILFEDYLAKRKDPAYRDLAVYDNQNVKVQVEWLGKVKDARKYPTTDYWPLFGINIWNGMPQPDGGVEWVPDSMTGQTYGTEAAAMEAYRDFLLKWTNCTTVESATGEVVFKEEDNVLSPPPPPDLNTPTVDPDSALLGAEGAW